MYNYFLIEPFETDESAATPPPPPAYRTTSRTYVRTQTPIPFPSEAEAARLLTLPTPPPSLLIPLSSPPPYISSPPLPLPLPPPILALPMLRLCLIAPAPRFEVGESSAAARQSRSTMGRKVDYNFVDTVDANIRASKRRSMDTIEVVNLRVSYQADFCRRESEEFCTRHQDAQGDRDDVDTLRRYLSSLCTTHEQERVKACQALDRSEAHNKALEARIAVLKTQAYRHEWQRQDANDHTTGHIMRIQALEARSRIDSFKDTEIEANKTSRNGDDSHDSRTGSRRTERPTRECTYSDFLKCKPLNFKGTKGVTVTHEVAYAMTWKTLKKMMTDKYYPRGEIKKLEIKTWNLKVKGIDVLSYNQRFQELALMCDRMFLEESDEVVKYVGGHPDMIHRSVMASKPKTMQDATEFATELMDQKIRTLAERQAENKRKFEDTSRNNQNQQQPLKRHNVVWALHCWA
nr:reverse transcriptase domain-containing protein [Tanacetum cinerariifolium]